MEEQTKKCPYCGKEILAVAKKCKYCGEWLDGSHQQKKQIQCPVCGETIDADVDTCPYCKEKIKTDDSHATESKPQSRKMSEDTKAFIFIGIAIFIISIVLFFIKGCGKENPPETMAQNDKDTVAVDNTEQETDNVLDSLLMIYTVAEPDGNGLIYCLNGVEGNYDNTMIVFDASTHKTKNVDICQFDAYNAEMIKITDYAVNDGNITFIISDGSRNGSGAFLCNTQVWEYTGATEIWENLSPDNDGCAGAKFTEDKTQVEIKTGHVLNEETATCEADYEYDYTTKVIQL